VTADTAGMTSRVGGPLLLFLCLVLGGASAAAPFANAAVQLLSVALLVILFWHPTPPPAGLAVWPPRLFLMFAAIMAAQVVPLPPSIWSSLPEAKGMLAGFELADVPPGWSSLSWAPDETIAACLSLLPPAAVFVALSRSPARERALSIWLLIVSATGMTLLGVTQRIGGIESDLYPYLVTNPGQPVGLFANRNHLSTLLLCTLPFVAAMARTGNASRPGRVGAFGGIAAILCGGVALVHSDAGLAMLPLVLAGCGAIVGRRRQAARPPIWAIAVAVAVGLAALAALIAVQTAPPTSPSADQRRGVIIPKTLRAAIDHMPFGTGGGSFQTVYPAYVDPAAASLEYVNHAHSDYVELLLEYGIVGGLIAMTTLALLARLAATRTVGGMLKADRRSIVVFESTVYPGVTEEVCGPELERISGLSCGEDFFLAYSPERINPGDREHAIDRIVKVVSGQTPQVLDAVADLYNRVTSAGVFRAASIKAAEAAKVIENAQRDINIAFVNEITQIFATMNLSVWDVLAAASTKWNFLKFEPGLVGGHCIGVDPYYLAHRATELGHDPRVILAGREMNDGMAGWLAKDIHKWNGSNPGRILVLGLAFKQDVPDLRNSKVADLITDFRDLGYYVDVHDPIVSIDDAMQEYGLELVLDPAGTYDLVVLAVPHRQLVQDFARFAGMIVEGGGFADLKNVLASSGNVPVGIRKWTM
jgi:UDP-N-acetyl-D-galactosamine dehydrogenase